MLDNYVSEWLPDEYKKRFNIIAGDNHLYTKQPKRVVYFEHGINWEGFSTSFNAGVHFCSTKEAYDHLIANGANAFWTGSWFEDEILTTNKSPQYLVYMPRHDTSNCFKDHKGNYIYRYTDEKKLLGLAKKYGCKDVYVSLIEDSLPTNYNKIKELRSDRHNPKEHFEKCKWILENAKVIYAGWRTTLLPYAHELGIKILNQKDVSRTVYFDGKSKDRILKALDTIGEKYEI